MTERTQPRTIDFTTNAPVEGRFDERWIHGRRGRKQRNEPAFQAQRYEANTYVLRESKCVNAEAPFLYLLFGNERAVLFDTGATKASADKPLREMVDGIIDTWLSDHPREHYELVVAHTHGHGDHVAGDSQFADRPAATIVGRELSDVQVYFGFTDWPEQIVQFDLGGRILDVTGTPGHHRASLTIYDPWTGFLLAGDNVLPGRIYAFDFPEYLESIERTVAFANARNVTHVMGCHIEMTRRPGRDYPLGCRYQPDEPPLEMTPKQLVAVREAARSIKDAPGAHRFDDFLIMNGPYRNYLPGLIARALWAKLSARRR